MTSANHRSGRARLTVLLGFAVCAALIPLFTLGAQAQRTDDATNTEAVRATMRSLLGDIRKLLDASLSEQWLASPGTDPAIEATITDMANRSGAFAAHAPQMDMAFMASVLEKYAWWLTIAYRQGQQPAFDELLHESLDVCIACHTGLPSERDSPAAEQFVSSSTVRELSVAKRYPLLIATRRFDDAMSQLEAAFAEPFKTWPRASKALRSYVLTAVRVKQDYERVARTLQSLTGRMDVPPELRREIEAWVVALRRESAASAGPPGPVRDLASVRHRIQRAEASMSTAAQSLIDYTMASAMLHEYLANQDLSATALSEASYLLGLCYHRIAMSETLPQAELYLEFSILADPSTDWADDAYSLLWMRVVESYADADAQLPEYMESHLNELEQMIDK